MAALSLFLALLLAVSAGHKYMARTQLAPVAAKLAGVPAALGPVLLLAAALLEAGAALALMVDATHDYGAWAAAAVWSLYALALARRYGQSLDCGCDFTRRARPVGLAAVARPLILALVALAMAYSPPAAFAADTIFAALAWLALYFAASELATLPSPARKVAR